MYIQYACTHMVHIMSCTPWGLCTEVLRISTIITTVVHSNVCTYKTVHNLHRFIQREQQVNTQACAGSLQIKMYYLTHLNYPV